MRTGAQPAQVDRRRVGERGIVGDRNFRAPRAVIELPLEGGPTPCLWRDGAPIECATGANGKRGAGRGVGADGLARDRDAVRSERANVSTTKTRSDGWRIGQKVASLPQLSSGDVGDRRAFEHVEVQPWIHDLIAAAGSSPRNRQDIVIHDDRVMRRVVMQVQDRAIVNDVVGGVEARAEAGVRQRDTIVRPIESRDIALRAAAALSGHVDDGIVEQSYPSAGVAGSGGIAFVEENVIHVVENVVDDGPIGVLADKIDSS